MHNREGCFLQVAQGPILWYNDRMNSVFDVSFDFTNDTPGFWKGYWDHEMGKSFCDPDALSPTLKQYHKILWSKQLPNGDYMELQNGTGSQYLTWKGFCFGSDSITASFRYEQYKQMIKDVMLFVGDYKRFFEYYTRSSYTIGGEIIFPKRKGSINQSRGCNAYIKDRFDLTLECIRKYYNNEYSPLYKTLLNNKDFFDLFVDFRGYVDFFYLQDMVSSDYSSVRFWLGDGEFRTFPLPQDVEEYLLWMNNQLDFVRERNARINKAING